MKSINDARILLVDDEPKLLSMVRDILRNEGFLKISEAGNARSALALFDTFRPDIVVLDVSLPGMDGFALFEALSMRRCVPALFLSARDEDADRLRGLGLGADDYITKPFLPKELVLRIGAILRRSYIRELQTESKPTFSLGDSYIDMNDGSVTGSSNSPDSPNRKQTLTAKEYLLLEKLYQNKNRIVTLDALCRAIWNDALSGYENTLMVHIRRLREKIETDPSHPVHLVTVRGLGYKLIVEAAK